MPSAARSRCASRCGLSCQNRRWGRTPTRGASPPGQTRSTLETSRRHRSRPTHSPSASTGRSFGRSRARRSLRPPVPLMPVPLMSPVPLTPQPNLLIRFDLPARRTYARWPDFLSTPSARRPVPLAGARSCCMLHGVRRAIAGRVRRRRFDTRRRTLQRSSCLSSRPTAPCCRSPGAIK